MTPAQAVAQARQGKLLPFYLVAGEERLLRDEVVAALRTAALAGGVAAFNEDKFTAGECAVEAVVSAARTMPMMAPRRFVIVRGGERWDAGESEGALERLAEYASAPVDTACMVIVATKLDGRRKLGKDARAKGTLVACDPLDSRSLPAWIVERIEAKGHAVDRDVAELLAALAGPQLSAIDDAIERLSLYVGDAAPIDEAAVSACVARIRTTDTWAMVDAVGARDLGRALSTLADAYDPRDHGLPLLGALAWSIRQLARYQAAIASGASADEAARRAGVFQPHRARELGFKARAVSRREVERWMLLLAETDLALKSSRRTADAILEDMLTRLCRAETRGPRPASNTARGSRPI